jgi:hypothetical protein
LDTLNKWKKTHKGPLSHKDVTKNINITRGGKGNMPKVKVGDTFQTIPWDADVVAGLIFKGFEVRADEGTDPGTYEMHKQQLEPRLRTLWGDKNMRAIGNRSTLAPWKNEQNAAPELSLPHINRSSDFVNIQPNPYIRYPIQEVDPRPTADEEQDIFQNRKKKPWET